MSAPLSNSLYSRKRVTNQTTYIEKYADNRKSMDKLHSKKEASTVDGSNKEAWTESSIDLLNKLRDLNKLDRQDDSEASVEEYGLP